MKIWLISVIHSIDVLCNLVFWWIPTFVLIAYTKIPGRSVAVSRRLAAIWLAAVAGVIFIPPEAALRQMLG
ncbi:hypothetical protein [Kingella denitrificans]|uniref:hypothetical protein n=1 Tax=Kingella denitrificans TaxID=502 RepID=UPI000B984742|nr:hypothetical protein [Kingella denitrificans]